MLEQTTFDHTYKEYHWLSEMRIYFLPTHRTHIAIVSQISVKETTKTTLFVVCTYNGAQTTEARAY